MGLFDKKYCDVCGEKIGLLGNRKLEDGNLCKECAARLSPFFSDRKNSTVDEIKSQLEYRENNRKVLESFRPTRVIGEDMKVLIDETKGQFAVTSATNLIKANPDVMEIKDVVSCNLDIQHTRTEVKRKDAEGNQVSYDPPRYEYSYTFYMEIGVRHPFFSRIHFRLNPTDIDIVSEPPRRMASTGVGRILSGMPGDIHPEYNVEYRGYQQMADEIIAALLPKTQSAATVPHPEQSEGAVSATSPEQVQGVQTADASAAGNGSRICPFCGTENKGKFCEECGAPL